MVEIGNVKEVIKDYIIKQLVSMGESSPAIRLLIPLAKRAITNNINSFDKFLKPIADKDGMIEIGSVLWRRICSCTSVCFCQISLNRDLSPVLLCK